MFEYLTLKDIKTCRLVSQKWKDIAARPFLDLTTVLFDSEKPTGLAQFENSLTDLKLIAYRFVSNKNSIWDVSQLEFFIQKCKYKIRELNLKRIRVGKDQTQFEMYDISQWIVMLPNLEKLEISCLKFRT